ncbi:histidine phosphatase family protein [Falsibacillus pallidus]|uniref:histidine phosphatase family protein n=1 Tax=Falsibacillus pallidus TaxID=493781 RepID=UPI003D993924
MELILARHGESEADLLNVHEGRADFSLTDRGRMQAEAFAEYASLYFSIDVMYCSTLKRARETAGFVHKKLNCPLHYLEDLMEWNNGVLAGLKREEAAKRYPEPEGGRKPHVPVENGESHIDFRLRIERAVSMIKHAHPDEKVMIVSHGGAISNIINALYQMPVVSPFRFATGDTGFHHFILKDGKVGTKVLNCQDHLKMDMR